MNSSQKSIFKSILHFSLIKKGIYRRARPQKMEPYQLFKEKNISLTMERYVHNHVYVQNKGTENENNQRIDDLYSR